MATLLLAIALGVGLGVGLHNHRNFSDAPTATSSAPASSQTPSVVPINHGVLNDTSLAAVSYNGDRYIFFQDINSTIRSKRFSTSASSWLPSSDWIYDGPVPRNNTPITAIEIDSTTEPVVLVFYIATNNTLAAKLYPLAGGGSFVASDVLSSSFFTRPFTRSLSVARLQSTTSAVLPNSSTPSVLKDEIFLFYESPVGNVTILHGSYYFLDNSSTLRDRWIWQNISDSFYPQNSSQSEGGWLGTPFSALTDIEKLPILSTCFFNPASLYDTASPPYLNGFLTNLTQISQEDVLKKSSKLC